LTGTAVSSAAILFDQIREGPNGIRARLLVAWVHPSTVIRNAPSLDDLESVEATAL
jgi:hypothetical protein